MYAYIVDVWWCCMHIMYIWLYERHIWAIYTCNRCVRCVTCLCFLSNFLLVSYMLCILSTSSYTSACLHVIHTTCCISAAKDTARPVHTHHRESTKLSTWSLSDCLRASCVSCMAIYSIHRRVNVCHFTMFANVRTTSITIRGSVTAFWKQISTCCTQ
jgi:hypothetical protein